MGRESDGAESPQIQQNSDDEYASANETDDDLLFALRVMWAHNRKPPPRPKKLSPSNINRLLGNPGNKRDGE